jgi:hypothetical protein
MILVNGKAHSDHGKVIRCDNGQESVERSWDVENAIISEKSEGYTQRPRI